MRLQQLPLALQLLHLFLAYLQHAIIIQALPLLCQENSALVLKATLQMRIANSQISAHVTNHMINGHLDFGFSRESFPCYILRSSGSKADMQSFQREACTKSNEFMSPPKFLAYISLMSPANEVVETSSSKVVSAETRSVRLGLPIFAAHSCICTQISVMAFDPASKACKSLNLSNLPTQASMHWPEPLKIAAFHD